MQKVLGEYHGTITTNLRSVAMCRIGGDSKFKTKKSFSEIIERNERAFEVTHGKDDPNYQMFQTMKAMLVTHVLRHH